jgi:hypothetical protein
MARVFASIPKVKGDQTLWVVLCVVNNGTLIEYFFI